MIISFILFILGLVIGSFINAFQYRIQEGKTIKGRSFCPDCKHQLAWYDLFPLFSWISLMGKCRYCRKPISFQYPVIELITGLVFVGVGFSSGISSKISEYIFGMGVINTSVLLRIVLTLLFLLFISFCGVLISLHDAKTFYVLSAYVYLAIVASVMANLLLYNGIWSASSLLNYFSPFILSALFVTVFFFSLYFFSKGTWMGAGDAEIALLMSVFLGWPKILVALYFAFITGSVWGLAKVYLFKNAKMKSEMPFGPFLITGMFFAFIFGAKIIDLYVNIYL